MSEPSSSAPVRAPQSGGSMASYGVVGGAQLVILVLYGAHKIGVDDMTPEVAGAIVGVAGAFGVGIIKAIEGIVDYVRSTRKGNP